MSERGRGDAQLLSVYREWGVVPKASRDDNFNRASEDLSNYQFVRKGDLVLNKMKTWQGSLAVSNYDGIVSPAYFVCRLDDRVHSRYLHYLLRSPLYIDLYAAVSKGIRPNQWDLPYDEFRKVPVITPDLEAQKSVATFLDDQIGRIDAAVRLRREQIDALEARLRALVGVHVDVDDAPLVPMRRVLAAIQTGSTPVADPVESDAGGGVGWYTPDSFLPLGVLGEPRRTYLSDDRLTLFPPDSVLFVGIGWASGRVAYLPEAGAGNQQLTALTPRPDVMLGRFLLWQMFHLGGTLRRNAPFTVIPVLSNDYLKSAPVRLPSISDQKKAVRILDSAAGGLSVTTAEMAAQINLLEERKRSLVTAAVTGEFDVTTASGRGI